MDSKVAEEVFVLNWEMRNLLNTKEVFRTDGKLHQQR